MKQLQAYTYTLPANGSVQIPAPNDNFIIQASTGPVSVRGDTFGKMAGLVAGQGLKSVPFNRLELFDESGAPNTVTILLSPVEFINQVFSGSVVVPGGVALVQATIDALTRPELPTAFWNSTAQMAVNTAQTVFLAAANTNGAIIWTAESADWSTGNGVAAFVAKATTPANPADGSVVAQSWYTGGETKSLLGIRLARPVRIPAGLGLYFIGNLGGQANQMRSCSYTLL